MKHLFYQALYFTTDVNQQIPEQLYVAVAQVMTYVYNLNAVDKISSTPKAFPQVPPELTFDSTLEMFQIN